MATLLRPIIAAALKVATTEDETKIQVVALLCLPACFINGPLIECSYWHIATGLPTDVSVEMFRKGCLYCDLPLGHLLIVLIDGSGSQSISIFETFLRNDPVTCKARFDVAFLFFGGRRYSEIGGLRRYRIAR